MRAIALGSAVDNEAAPKRTPLILLWAFCTLIWSIFTPPHKTFPARVALLQPLWGVRMSTLDETWAQDLLLLLCLHSAYTYWTGIWRFPTVNDLTWLDWQSDIMQIYVKTFSLLAACGALAGGIVYRGNQMGSNEQSSSLRAQRIDEQLLPPLLIPSRTTHSRLFPVKHGFSYSYLLVGIPVGMKGAVGVALSVDTRTRNWFHISSADYLARGGAHLGLAEKLKRYLHTQGVTDRDYSFAYLVTAPRFLSYSFNPVSFWYLYNSDAVLKYMILEVNNTFDERRMYLLNADSAKYEHGTALHGQFAGMPHESPGKLMFSEVWQKDFHVSPFNSRNGSYSLRASDPLVAYETSGHVRIDNTIVLRSSKESAKVVARIWSEGEPKDATEIKRLQLYRFIASWWWVGLATFPRIVWEAQKLFFQRKLHVWYRPEVTQSSISKTYTDDERWLECLFHAFLKNVVESSKDPLRLQYLPAHASGDEIVLYSSGFIYEEDRQNTLTLKVLSPSFYSRFVHYAHTKEAFDRECLATDEKNKTISIENLGLLSTLLDAIQKYEPGRTPRQSNLEQVRWSCLRRLRCPPSNASYPHEVVPEAGYNVADIRTFSNSDLDKFVKARFDDASVYRRIVTKLFLAQRFALGVPILIVAVDWLFRAACILTMLHCCSQWQTIDIMRSKESGPKEFDGDDVWRFAALLLLANSTHLWNFLKG